MNASSFASSNGLQFTHPYLAVVLGGGFTGMLAAATLSRHADVIVVEREPRTPALPTDLPQARHAQLLTGDGARLVEALLPGSVDQWLGEGARRMPVPAGFADRSPKSWLGRRLHSQYLLACSRDLLDRVIHRQVPGLPGVSILDGTEAAELTGTAEHITGVRVRDTTGGGTYRLDADLVIDATGRHSTTPSRLAALGLPTAPEDVSDTGIVAATRIFRAPEGTENCPVLTDRSPLAQPVPGPFAPRRALPGKTATLVPIEGGRWLVTLTGTGDDRPSEHAGRFVPFARRCSPLIGDLIAGAEPLSEVRLTRDTAGRRRRYEQLASWPTGFIVLGGAVVSLAADCGQGLSLAAHGATALRRVLRRHGMDDPALAQRTQRAIGRLVQEPWALAAGEALPFPGTGRTAVRRAYVDVVTPAAPAAPFLRPSAALDSLRSTARRRPAAGGSPARQAAPRPATGPLPTTPGPSSAAGSRPPTSAGAASPLPALPAPTLSAVPPVPGQPSSPSRRPGSAPAPGRFPRRLGFAPTALRRFGGASRRKPAEG
ncbi:pyridine nucleotide-disulfide oxidoreductase [Streptomyces sp. TM32]|uniref:FAD-dependent monooxygenase n=1 Tax=Streptomyces sp. TM32 TaxID=1652669 RepID=UPI0010136083|nr:FAD-dependent monooxygenase [Streptomyces sp. TM32]RXS86491.1 pyridine nucleotide-disulfide oxidoreductase [Streptomyces sp. TM32]